MWDRWTSTGTQGQGIQIVEPKLVRVTDLNTAKLLNIPMLANESRPFGIRITRINTGKVESSPIDYKFGITHESADPNIAINKSSACIFDTHKKTTIPQNLSTTNLALLAYPNPTNGTLNLSFNLPQAEQNVNLSIYDLQGRLIKTLFDNNNVENGVYNFETETTQLTTGMYVAVLKATNHQINTKITIVK